MIVTRETDYALRILRALEEGRSMTAGELAEEEELPQKFAYKILKKLHKAGYIRIRRGASGGCATASRLPWLLWMADVSVLQLRLWESLREHLSMHCSIPRREFSLESPSASNRAFPSNWRIWQRSFAAPDSWFTALRN